MQANDIHILKEMVNGGDKLLPGHNRCTPTKSVLIVFRPTVFIPEFVLIEPTRQFRSKCGSTFHLSMSPHAKFSESIETLPRNNPSGNYCRASVRANSHQWSVCRHRYGIARGLRATMPL